eukprot:scaffold64_cov199-Ochromonas_danica.AAC.1
MQDIEEENRKTEEVRKILEDRHRTEEEEENRKTEEVRKILKKRHRTEEEEEVCGLLDAVPHKVARVELERKLAQVQESSRAEIADLNNKLEAIANPREADRIVTESKLQQIQESILQAEIADLNNKLEREKAARVALERKLEEALTVNDKLFTLLKDGQIAILLRDCSTNWQQMIESGDVTVFKTLETYNAIYRIPVSLIHHSFTMIVDGIENKDMSALHMAAVKGNAVMTRLLLLHPAIDVNAVDSEDGVTPFICACEEGHADVVKILLLDQRVDVNKTDEDGETALDVAESEEIKALLRAKGAI